MNTRDRILEMAESDYQKFSSALNPGVQNMVGVRLPNLRKLAKEISKGDWASFLKSDTIYFEEIMLKGMVIGQLKEDIDTVLALAEEFIPYIDNWAVCDSFCTGLKITSKNTETVWGFMNDYFHSENEFDVRFAVVMSLGYYVSEEYLDKLFEKFNLINHDGYYVKMAVAWAVSVCYVKFPEKTMPFLENNKMDDFTQNKSIEKIIQSRRADNTQKAEVR